MAGSIVVPEVHLEFLETAGPEDKLAFAMAWQRYGSIAQVDPALVHRSKRMKQRLLWQAVYEHAYRCTTAGHSLLRTWQQLESRIGTATCTAQFQTEYFKAVVVPKGYYSVFGDKAVLMFFQIVWLVPPQDKFTTAGRQAVPPSYLDVAVLWLAVWPPSMPGVVTRERFPDVLEVYPGSSLAVHSGHHRNLCASTHRVE